MSTLFRNTLLRRLRKISTQSAFPVIFLNVVAAFCIGFSLSDASANLASPAEPGSVGTARPQTAAPDDRNKSSTESTANSKATSKADSTTELSKATDNKSDEQNLSDSLQASAPGVIRQVHQQETATVTVDLDRDSMGVAEHLRYTLTVETSNDASVEFEAVNDFFGPFKVISYNPFGPIKMPDQQLRWQREYVLEADAPGELQIPALTVSFFPPEKECITADACEFSAHGRRSDRRNPIPVDYEIQTDPVSIPVSTILTDDVDLTKPRDVKPPVVLAAMTGAQGMTASKTVWILLLLVAAAVLLWAFNLRRGNPVAASAPAESLSAREHALEALAALRDQRLPAKGQHQAHHTRLSYILRDYVARAFDITALEKTTAEITKTVADHPKLSGHSAMVSKLLGLSDLAKFAKAYPDANTSDDMLDEIQTIIENTSREADDATG